MGLFLDCQSASKGLFSEREQQLEFFKNGRNDKQKYEAEIAKIEGKHGLIYTGIDRRYDVDLSPEEAAAIFNEAFGGQGFAMKRGVNPETAKHHIAKAKDLHLRMQKAADRTADVLYQVDISTSSFNQYALNLLDYTSENYLEEKNNKEIITVLQGNDNVKKGELINSSITTLLSADFSQYENLSDDDLMQRGPSIALELMKLGCVAKMYHAAVEERIIEQENIALSDRLTKLSDKAMSYFEQLDMRMTMMCQPLSAYIDYNSMKSHGELGTKLLPESLIRKYPADPAKTSLLQNYNSMLLKYADYISNTDYSGKLRETLNNILFNYSAKEGDYQFVVEDKYTPGKFRSFDNVHDAAEYLNDESLFANGSRPSVYLVNGDDEPVGLSIDPSVQGGTGIRLYNIDLDDNSIVNLRKIANYDAHRTYIKTMYDCLSAENTALLKLSNSKEYKDVLDQMGEVYNRTSGGNPSAESLAEANRELIELGRKCNLYLEKKEKDFEKDGTLNDRSLNRVDIVKEIAKFANTACFGKRTPELTNAQKQNALKTEKFKDLREAGKFRFVFSASPEIFLNNLKKTRDELYKTNGVFTKDSKEFQLVQHDLDQAIANIEKANEILGAESTLDKIKPFLRNVKASLDDYIKSRTHKNNELKAKGKAPNDRTMTRLQITGELFKVTNELVPEPISVKERVVRRLRDGAITQLFKTKPQKASEMLLRIDNDIPHVMKSDTIKGWFDSKHKYQINDILYNFNNDIKQIKEITALDNTMKDPQKADEFKRVIAHVQAVDKSLSQKGLPNNKTNVSAESKAIKENAKQNEKSAGRIIPS